MSSSTGTISFSGLSSGLDTTSIVSSLVAVQGQPMTVLQQEQKDLTTKSGKITDIKTQLTALQTAAQALEKRSDTLATSATSSTPGVLTATTTGGAAAGSYPITVNSLASAQRNYSSTVSSESDAGVASGTLGIQVGSGDPISVSIDATDSLDSIASKINAAGAGVTAAVFSDGTSYRLQVTGNATGAKNAVTFSEGDGLALGLSDPTSAKQAATDASITLDGMTVTSSTNAITNAVPGVTVNVASLGSSTVNVALDSSGLSTKLNTFVTAYNKVMGTLNAAFTYTPGVAQGQDSLAGDTTMRSLQNQLRSLASSVMSNGTSHYNTLNSIGLTTQSSGTINFDATKFNTAVAADYTGVASLLAGATDKTGVMSMFDTGLNGFTQSGGMLDNKISNITSQNKDITGQLASMKVRLDQYQQMLTDQFNALESTMSQLKSQGNALTSMLNSLSSSSSSG